VSLAADALGLLRLGAAVALPNEIADAAGAPHASWGPLCLFAIAATSDFLDGRLAPIETEIVFGELDRLTRQIRRRERHAGRRPSRAQYWLAGR